MKTILGKDIELVEVSKHKVFIHHINGSVTEITPDVETELTGVTYCADNIYTFI